MINALRSSIEDVKAINARLMTIKLRGEIDIHIVAAYAQTADAQQDDTDTFYTHEHYNK